jgi:Tfp pilus assembly protein PilO
MKNRIKEFLNDAAGEISFGLRSLCGRPSPLKRFIIVAIAGAIMGIASFGILVSSIYKIGYTNAKEEIPKANFIRQMQLKNDSINHLKQQLYDYEQEQSGQ